MATTLSLAGERLSSDDEIPVLLADQEKINQFAKLNNRSCDLKELLDSKKNEIQVLDDASTDLLTLEDDSFVPYKTGEVFILSSQDRSQDEFEARKVQLQGEVQEIQTAMAEVDRHMAGLKIQLYAKFGSSINLEKD